MNSSSFAVQAALLPLVQQGKPLQEILDSIEILLSTPLSFRPFDDMTMCISSKNHPDVCQKEYLDFIHDGLDYAPQLLSDINQATMNEYGYRLIVSEKFTYSKYILGDVSIHGKYLGLLAIPEAGIPLEKIDYSLLNECSKMIALAWLVERSTHDVSESKLLLALLQGKIHSKTQLALFLKNSAVLENRKWQLLIIKEPKRKLTDVILTLNSSLKIVDTAIYQGCICILIEPLIDQYDSSVIEQLELFGKEFDTHIYISDYFEDLLKCHHLFLQIASYPGDTKGNTKRVIFLRDTKVYRLLSSSGLSVEQLKDFCDERVIDLMLNDFHNNGCLYETVCCYIDCCRSISEVSKQLYVHSNTVFYRLNRLKQFQLDINNSKDIENIVLTRHLIEYIRLSDDSFPFNIPAKK